MTSIVDGGPKRGVFFWEERGLVLDVPEANPYGGLLARALAPHGIALESGWTIDPDWVRAQHARGVQLLHLNWLHRFYADPDPNVRRERFRTLVTSLVLARRLGMRLVWTMHNLFPHEVQDTRLDRRARRLVCTLAHAVIVHCQRAAELLAQHFGRRHDVHVIPHGHFMDVYPNTVGRAAAREALGVPPDGFVYVFLGYVRAYKGVERLLELFETLPDARLRLVIAGRVHSSYRGPLPDAAGAMRDPRILFRPGQVPIDELQVYFNAADAAVLPFVDALTSGSAITALGFGCPIVVPNVGCLTELVGDGRCGVLYDGLQPDALRRAMEEVQARSGSTARERARSRARELGWEGIAEQTLNAYGMAPAHLTQAGSAPSTLARPGPSPRSVPR
jgi:glycosyltransferase involved in cell wall biosynthesis